MNGPQKSDRRPRELTVEELELWRKITYTIKPRKQRAPEGFDGVGALGSGKKHEKAMSRPDRIFATADYTPTLQAPRTLSAEPNSTLGRRKRRSLQAGRADIDAAIDLHGLDQGRAHLALVDFISRAHAGDLRLVLVITGKGGEKYSSDSTSPGREVGILRRLAPKWLLTPPLRTYVRGYEEATRTHGGEGAIYVQLRRNRHNNDSNGY